MAPRRGKDTAHVRILSLAPRPLLNPVTLLYYTSPFGLLGLLPIALLREAAPLSKYLAESSEAAAVVTLVLLGACLGFSLLLTELKVRLIALDCT